MILKLRYNESVSHSTRAVFVRGSSPDIWLKEVDHLGIPLTESEFYVVPESIQSLTPAGLFIIIKSADKIKSTNCYDPYGLIGGKLYVPVHSEITPEINVHELNKLLLYDIQLFHPTIGLIGFETSDKIQLQDLLEYPKAQEKKWTFAHPGISLNKRLQEIYIKQPTAKDIMDSFKESIDTKPLEDIPGKEETSSLNKIVDPIKSGLLRTTLFLVRLIPATNYSGKKGIFDHVEKWLNQNLENLDKRRNKELNRLIKLFEENMNEALRYAIPLDSPYLNRGTAEQQSSRLFRNSSIFDLTKLGGGGRVDTWDVSSYYNDLRNKYQRAAQKEIESKDFKKAAYVYAHLLGDYNAAAKVLEQGKHYREAAALYKEHLKNIPAAAECLERGGLLLEAIDLYTDLHKYEKVADLYQSIDQHKNAIRNYEKIIELNLKGGDNLEAARIISDKLQDSERGKQILLQGWKNSNQSEQCLKRYFEIVTSDKNKKVSYEVHDIYKHHTSKPQRTSFLNVLSFLIQKNKEEDTLQKSKEIAYEIISEQIQEGDVSNLHSLKKFIPEDRMIFSDCSRFISKDRMKSVKQNSSSVLQLDGSIHWHTATAHRNQFLILGTKSSRLYLARGNWYGNLEYYSWPNEIDSGSFSFITEPYTSDAIIIRCDGIPLEEKVLPKNKYFDEELKVSSLPWLDHKFLCATFIPGKEFIAVKSTHFSLDMYHCDKEGRLTKTMPCVFNSENQLLLNPLTKYSELIFRKDFYYTYKGNFFIKISEKGIAERFNVNARIEMIAATNISSEVHIAIGTNNGCILYAPYVGFNIADIPFAKDIIPIDLQFIASDILVIAGKNKAVIFQIKGSVYKPLLTFEPTANLTSILPTANRNKCGFLEDTGRISVYEFEIE